MSLECTKCGYPAPQTPVCPECGGEDFQSTHERTAKRWWRVVALLLVVQVAHAGSDVAAGIATARWRSTRMPTPTGFVAWVGNYLRDEFVIGWVALGTLVFGTGFLVAGLTVRERRAAYLIGAGVVCVAYDAAWMFNNALVIARTL